MIDHRIESNWVRMWYMKHLKNGEVIYKWEYEPNYGMLRPDSHVVIRSQFDHKYRSDFIEVDLSLRNEFDKIAKYNYWHESEGYAKQWWADKVSDFPDIKIFTLTNKRKQRIEELVKKENKRKLVFNVNLIDGTKGETINKWNLRRS